jgi:tetratricopeptide (TPR) repeat protein
MTSPASNRSLLAGLLVAATLAAYWPALDAGFVWDDDDYVVENTALRSADGLARIWLDFEATPQYYPMVHSTFWVEYQLWQLNPAGYHLVNVLLHALAALLVWRVLAQLGVPGSWLAAAIFALHPVHVETVAWITERKNVLSAVFYLAALLAYLRAAGVGGSTPDERASKRSYALSLIAFAGALLSKTVTGSLPAVILLLLWWQKGGISRRDVLLVLPFLLLSAAFGVLTIQLETQHVGAVGWEWDLTFVERGLIAGRALWFYAGKLLWPNPLIFSYPRWQVDAASWQAFLYPVATLALVATLFLARGRIGRGPVTAVLVFAGTLFPALGFFDVYPMRYSFVADHFQYLASLGLIAGFAALVVRFAGRVPAGSAMPSRVVVLLLLATLAALTWNQARVYRDLETLWRDTLAKNPESWLAHDNLGVLLQQRGRLEEAIGHFRAAIRIEPDHHEGYNNLGSALRERGEPDAALAQLRRSLEVEPDYFPAHNNLGLTQHDRGVYDEAVRSFEYALRLDPSSAAAHTNLGVTLAAQGRLEEAARHHRAALQADPALAGAHTNLAAVLVEQGRIDEAIEHLQRVVELQPDSQAAKQTLRRVQKYRVRLLRQQQG